MKHQYSDIKQQLESSGYSLLPQFISEAEFELCKRVADRLEAYPEERGGPMKYFEESIQQKEILNRVEEFCDIDNEFNNLLNRRFVQLLEDILGGNYILFKEKINFKMPGGGGFNIHQDFPAFNRFVEDEMLVFMLPLQETNQSNGCLQVASNYFKKELIQHENGTVSPEKLTHIIWKNIKMRERDLLIFSSFLLHKSEPNKSDKSRRSYFLTYNSSKWGDVRSQYFLYKRTSFPPRIERDKNVNLDTWKEKLARKIL